MTARLTNSYAEDREKARRPYGDVPCLRGEGGGDLFPALHENLARKA